MLAKSSRASWTVFPFTLSPLPFSRSASPLLPIFLWLTLLAPACGHAPPGRGAGEIETTVATNGSGQSKDQVSFRVETVVANIEVPWSIVWAPDGRMLFTERAGRVRVYENGKLRTQPLFTVPDVEPS